MMVCHIAGTDLPCTGARPMPGLHARYIG
jgi:hypothetical protein